MLVFGDKSFEVRALSAEQEAAWSAYCRKLAKSIDRPVARFIAKHCDGLDAEDQQRLLNAWMSSGQWQEPDEEATKEARESRLAACALAMFCLAPAPTWTEAKELITDNNKRQLWDAIHRAANPSNEDIRAANAELRERLQARQGKEAATEGDTDSGGE